MFSFWGRFFFYLLIGFLFLGFSLYVYWVFWYHGRGAPWIDSLLWFRNPDFGFVLHYGLILGFFAFSVGVFVSTLFFLREMGKLSRYENLRERSEKLEDKVSSLSEEERELRKRVETLQKSKKKLTTSLDELRRRAEALRSEVRKLEEKRATLDLLVNKAVKKGYRDGYERAYRSVIEELRSLRAQKSALVDLFNREKELREVFRKITGKKLLQFLNEAKKRAKES